MKTLIVRVTLGDDDTTPGEAVYARTVRPVKVPREADTEAETVIEVEPAYRVVEPGVVGVVEDPMAATVAVLLALIRRSMAPVLVISQ